MSIQPVEFPSAMLLPALLVVALLLVCLALVVAKQPSDFVIERSTLVNAAPETIFPRVDNLKRWPSWSPWEYLDPRMKKTWSGPEEGPGAVYEWDGNRKAGAGRMTIVESRPCSLVGFQLEFLRPMRATNGCEFSFQPEGGQTRVTWRMTGRNGFAGKLFGLLMNIDRMVGQDFEKGLASLKAESEAAA